MKCVMALENLKRFCMTFLCSPSLTEPLGAVDKGETRPKLEIS
jgi:hypothetical protein